MRALAFVAVLIFTVAGCAAQPVPSSIESATMSADRTITLRLRAQDGRGATGDGVLVYRTGSRDLEEVLGHIGGLKPGETKPVPPWS